VSLEANEGAPRIRSYVKRAGRMTDMQRQSYAGLSEKYCIHPGEGFLDPQSIFGRSTPLILEIGFGMGVATAIIAEQSPDRDFIGIEVHRPGIGKLMAEIEEKKLRNVRIIEDDAVEVLERSIAPASLSGIHLFFPDPWPKKRHNKRRILRAEFAALAFSRIASGGYFYMVTDWEEYAQEALATLTACPQAVNSCDGFAKRQEWRPVTKFERKAGLAGRSVRELFFLKP
jgi:tRNA (guanine-N7-)-methyltransferase